MSFDVFHWLNCWQWWGDRWRCMSLCGGGEEKSGFWTGGEKIISISSHTPWFLCLFEHGCCNYIWHTPCYPSLSYSLWFGLFLQRFEKNAFYGCMFFIVLFFNSWYLLMFLSRISILTTISLFIQTLVVTSFDVSNGHRHYTLTAGSVVLHIIIVIMTILYYLVFH